MSTKKTPTKTEAAKRISEIEKEKETLQAIIDAKDENANDYTNLETLADVCKKTNVPLKELLGMKLSKGLSRFQKNLHGCLKLFVVTEAINMDGDEKWEPDWNSSDSKYFVWVRIKEDSSKKSGFGFASSHFVYYDDYAAAGSRLLFRDRERALYAIKTFPDVYKEFILI